MDFERRTTDIQHSMHPLHCPSNRCSVFGVRYSMFWSSLFLFATPRGFAKPETNALPALSPPYGQMPPTFWEQHGTAIFAGSLIFLALAAAVVWQILKPRPQPVVPPGIAARKALAKCLGRPEDGIVLSEVSQTLRRYVGAVFEFSPGELTTAEFCRELERSEKIAPQLTRAISDFLRACDERKFSPAVSSAPLNAADRALQFLALTEKETRRQDSCASKNEQRV